MAATTEAKAKAANVEKDNNNFFLCSFAAPFCIFVSTRPFNRLQIHFKVSRGSEARQLLNNEAKCMRGVRKGDTCSHSNNKYNSVVFFVQFLLHASLESVANLTDYEAKVSGGTERTKCTPNASKDSNCHRVCMCMSMSWTEYRSVR